MAQVIVSGHGGYASAVRDNLTMLLGVPEGFHFVDFNPGDDLTDLTAGLAAAVEACGGEDILFCCDLTGGSPFRQCAMLCVERPGCVAVAGLNQAAYAEMVYNLDQPPSALCNMAIETTKESIQRFPE